MTREELDRIKSVNPAPEVAEALGLEVRSRKTLCPFHMEKTASLVLYEGSGGFHCFGCGANGDVFALVMKVLGVSFPGAVQWLCQRAGIPEPKKERVRGKSKLAETARLSAKRERDSFNSWVDREWTRLLGAYRGEFELTGYWLSCLRDAEKMRWAVSDDLLGEITSGLARCRAGEVQAAYQIDTWEALADDERHKLWKTDLVIDEAGVEINNG